MLHYLPCMLSGDSGSSHNPRHSGRGRRPRARNPYSRIVVMDSGLLAEPVIGLATPGRTGRLAPGMTGFRLHRASSFFTIALALEKSIRPAKRSLSAVMVRPMSLSVAASSSLMSAEMAWPASRSERCCGR
jgi:hypothetical protein